LGTAGTQGNQGRQGNQGNIGITGNQGNQGRQGNQGDLGTAGTQGNQGRQGNQGNIGITGNQGNQGIAGSGNFINRHVRQGTATYTGTNFNIITTDDVGLHQTLGQYKFRTYFNGYKLITISSTQYEIKIDFTLEYSIAMRNLPGWIIRVSDLKVANHSGFWTTYTNASPPVYISGGILEEKYIQITPNFSPPSFTTINIKSLISQLSPLDLMGTGSNSDITFKYYTETLSYNITPTV